MNIKPDIKTIKDVLNSGPYRVPRFQRAYSWQNEQLLDLFEDIINKIEDVENVEPLYIGAFVFNNESKKITGRYDIVDGQQRLITLTLFFAALRDLYKSIAQDQSAKGIQANFIVATDEDNNLYFRVFFHTEEQNDFYTKYFLEYQNQSVAKKLPLTTEQQNLFNTYSFFTEKLNERLSSYISEEQKINFLKKIRETLSDILAVSIEVDSEDSAYQVFETLNSKGLRLSQIDLLKNLVLQKYKPEKEIDRARNIWDNSIIRSLENNKLLADRFLRYFWLSKYKFVSGKYLYKSIKRQITNFKIFLDELETEAKQYIVINRPTVDKFGSDTYSVPIFSSLELMKSLQVQQGDPLILSLFRAFREKRISKAQLNTCLELVENFTFLFTIASKNPSGIERLFSKYALLTQTAKDGNEFNTKILRDLKEIFKNKMPEYSEFAPNFKLLNYVDNKSLCFLILQKINYVKHKQSRNIKFQNVGIEHVFPEKPNSLWKVAKKDFSQKVNVIGNLLLLENEINERIGNKVFSDKRKGYKDSSIYMPKEFSIEYTSWDFNKIDERSEQLASVAYNDVWSL